MAGATGVLAGVPGTSASLAYPIWAWRERPAIFLALGAPTILAGLITRQRENLPASPERTLPRPSADIKHGIPGLPSRS